MERWGLGPSVLLDRHPGVVFVRVSGFGQTGPQAQRPGFGTLAEALSGYAGMQGVEGDAPQLPALPLADMTAGSWGTSAALAALLHRERTGQGQVIDVSLYEPLFAMLEPLPAVYALTGEESPRLGNRMPFAAPRGAYRTADDRWVGLSGTAPAAARRVLEMIGGAALADDPRFVDNAARVAHGEELDAVIAAWVRDRTLAQAMAAFEAADAAAAPVYRMADAFSDPHFAARDSIVQVPDSELGTVAMTGVVPRFSATPGEVRWAGPALGSANGAIYGELLGLGQEQLAALQADGVV
jgi:formyl-CoA transferase